MLKSVTVRTAPYRFYFDQSAKSSLKGHFSRTRKGSDRIFNTPFAKTESTPELIQSWIKELKAVEKSWPGLYKYELDMAAKVGPLSVMEPLKERIPSIVEYYQDILDPGDPISSHAIAAVVKEWQPARGLFIRNAHNTVLNMKLSSNSGSPFFTKRRNVLGKSSLTIEGHYSYTGRYENCAVLGWRGQEGGYSKADVKQRVIWMFPFSVNVAELQVYQPLISAAQKHNLVPPWISMNAVDNNVTKLFNTKGKRDNIVCTDFTRFDQHFNVNLQDAARSCLKRIFNTSIDNWLDQVFPIKYNIPLAINMLNDTLELELTQGNHGMASGSGGTNADETLAHRAMQYESAIRHGQILNKYSMCLGDDGILSYPGCTAEEISADYMSHGQVMQLQKQSESTQECIFLRRWYNSDYRLEDICRGVYPTTRALGRLRYLERYMNPRFWSAKMVALRQLSILENVKWHPMREQFAIFCMKRDKFRLGLDIPGFLDHLPTMVREANDYMPDFMGYTKTLQSEGDPTYGIESWWIVNFLKSV